jgi:hypothetical protein
MWCRVRRRRASWTGADGMACKGLGVQIPSAPPGTTHLPLRLEQCASCWVDLPIAPQHALVGIWPRVIGGSRWKAPSSPLTTPTSTPSGTKRHTCRPTSSSRPRRSQWILPRSSASAAASPGSRSRCSSRPGGGPWIPTPRRSWRCGSAMSASPGWGRSSPQSPQEPEGSTGGRLGPIAPDCKALPIRPLMEQL